MSVNVVCKTCLEEYDVPAERAGQRFRCRECGESITVPGGETRSKRRRPPTAVRGKTSQRSAPRKKASQPVDVGKIIGYVIVGAIALGAVIYLSMVVVDTTGSLWFLIPVTGVGMIFVGFFTGAYLGMDSEERDGPTILYGGDLMLWYFLRYPSASWPGYLLVLGGLAVLGCSFLFLDEPDF